MMRSTVLLTAGQLGSYALSFGRTVILARVLTKADFGLTAVFAMTVTLLELAGRMAFGQQIVQSKDGDTNEFQSTTQAFQCALASIGAVLMILLSHPMAVAMKVPQLSWAFALLALVPLTRGFENLDYFRQQRHLRYWPAVLCDFVPQAVVTAAAWPLAIWIGDFRVIVYLMIAKALLGVLMTHLVARHPYRWAWERQHVRGMLAFGLPLLLNGLLMFGSQQADQVLIGACLSLEKLANYALAMSLVSIPGSIFAQVGTSLMLPILSRAQEDRVQFRAHYRDCAVFAVIAAAFCVGPLILAGEQFVTLVYGHKYTGAGLVIAVLGTAAAVRFLRIVPAIASMARADTVNQLYTNICRAVSLPAAAAVAFLGGGVVAIAACALGAELAAAVISAVRLQRRQGVPVGDIGGAAAYLLGLIAIAIAVPWIGGTKWSYPAAAAALAGYLALAAGAARWLFPSAIAAMAAPLRRRFGRPTAELPA